MCLDCDFERENVDLKFVSMISVIVIVIVFGFVFVFVFGSKFFFFGWATNWVQSFNRAHRARLGRVWGSGKKPA